MEVTEDEIHTRKQDRYEILERLGEGSFGEVRRGIDTFSGTVVAVKQVRLLAKTRLLPKAVFREVEALKQLSECKFVAKILDVYGGESVLCIVMEYLDRNLADFIERASDSLLRAQLKCFFQMMLQAIAYCHGRSIIHRDIKPSSNFNIAFSFLFLSLTMRFVDFLIAKDGCIKLADFGLARIWDRDIDEDLSHQVSTRHYRAPELLFAARRYTSAVDIWSLAVVFVELITLRTLFPSHNDLDAMFKVFQLMGSPTPERWPVNYCYYLIYFLSQNISVFCCV